MNQDGKKRFKLPVHNITSKPKEKAYNQDIEVVGQTNGNARFIKV